MYIRRTSMLSIVCDGRDLAATPVRELHKLAFGFAENEGGRLRSGSPIAAGRPDLEMLSA